MIRVKFKKGFTIVELMLAMTVVAVLMLSIAVMTIQITNIITRGKTYSDLNAAGRTINADFTRTFNSVLDVEGWSGGSTVSDNKYVNVDASGSGAFCMGEVSYLWNTNRGLIGGTVPIRYAGAGKTDQTIRLVKVQDSGKKYCGKDGRGLWGSVPRDSSTVNILSSGENDLRLYDIRFSTSANLKDTLSGQTFINISYVLGTRDDGAVNTQALNCENDTKNNYCAINKFEISVRTLGRKT